jgi:hypothetical protein
VIVLNEIDETPIALYLGRKGFSGDVMHIYLAAMLDVEFFRPESSCQFVEVRVSVRRL